MPSLRKKIKRQHPLHWLIEPLMEEPGLLEEPMFGCHICYLHGRLSRVLASGDEPWNGLPVPTEKQFYDSVMKDFKFQGNRYSLNERLHRT